MTKEQWKIGNEFKPYHSSASHIEPGYRDGWNACFERAQAEFMRLRALLEQGQNVDEDDCRNE